MDIFKNSEFLLMKNKIIIQKHIYKQININDIINKQ